MPPTAAVAPPACALRARSIRHATPEDRLTRLLAAISLVIWAIALIAIGVAIGTGVIPTGHRGFYAAAFVVCGAASLIFAIVQARRDA